ncbi:MAG: putative peptidoglycan lipid flippase [Actinomycetota bacterium]
MTTPALTTTRGAGRDAATVTTWNLISRLTGFARVVVLGGALGATRLGDTYQASNQVSNILFEFLAAGTLSAVLVPGLVARITAGDRDGARAFAGTLLGRALVVLAPIVVFGAIFARPAMHLFFSGNDASTRAAQIRLGAFLLLFVLPQLLLYAWGAVITALLHADGRFAAAALAPVANNVVVTAALGLFWLRGASGLHLGLSDKMLLGGGALGGVLCMTAIPAIAARRAGLSVAPVWRSSVHATTPVGDVLWASLVVVPAQLFLLGSLVVAGRVAGGVVACQIGFTLFLLPHALLGHPIATVAYPRLAASWANDDAAELRRSAGRGLTAALLLTAPAAALLAALAPWVVRVVAVGALAHGTGDALVAAALTGYAVGLSAYSWSLFMTRVSYASGDVRAPGVAAVIGGACGAVVLVAMSGRADTTVLRWIGLAHSAMAALMVAGLVVVLVRRGVLEMQVRRWATVVMAAVIAGVATRWLADAVGGTSRFASATTVGAAAVAGLAVYVVALWVGGIRPRAALDLFAL